MKIVFLSPVHPLLTAGDPLPRWQMQASWVRALERQGHLVKVVKYTPDNKIRLNWVERIWWNIKVIREIGEIREFGEFVGSHKGLTLRQAQGQTLRPDLIIYSLGADVMLPATIKLLKFKLSAPLVVLSGVSPIVNGNPRERKMAPLFDLVATNDPGHANEWKKLGAKSADVLPISGIDTELHYPRFRLSRDSSTFFSGDARLSNSSHKPIDVLFIGTMTVERKIFFDKLSHLLPSKVKMVVKEFVWEEEYAQLMSRAKIGINLLRPEMKNGANLRLFEIPAFGALEITSYSQKEWLTPGTEVEVFGSAEEAAELIKKYLVVNETREKMATRARQRVVREHTFDDRVKKLMEFIKVRPWVPKVGPLDSSVDVSVCIVNYKTDRELARCTASIRKFTKRVSYEIIVVDNSKNNRWFSGGNNLAAGKARGKYLFFANPDIYLKSDAVSELVKWLDNHPRVAAAEPLQLDDDGEVLPTGSKLNSPWLDLVELTFLSRLFGSVWRRGKLLTLNSINKFRQSGLDRRQNWRTEIISGAAMMVDKNIFDLVGGFSEKLKLFYTDTDLCRRILSTGRQIWHVGEIAVYHSLSASTNQLNPRFRNQIFASDAREYYRSIGKPFAAEVLYLSMIINGRLFLK